MDGTKSEVTLRRADPKDTLPDVRFSSAADPRRSPVGTSANFEVAAFYGSLEATKRSRIVRRHPVIPRRVKVEPSPRRLRAEPMEMQTEPFGRFGRRSRVGH